MYTAVFKLDELIRTSGYKPKSKFGNKCTSFVAEQEMADLDPNALAAAPRVNEVMEKITEQLQIQPNGDFQSSCREVCANHKLPHSRWTLKEKIWNYQFGFLATLVNNVIRDENRPAKEDLSHLGFIGAQNKRGNFFVKLNDKIKKDDYIIHKILDKSGNRGHFYNYKLSEGSQHLDVGDCFLMTATPARHEFNNYDGGKNTYFNRITILENKGSAESPKEPQPERTWQEVLANDEELNIDSPSPVPDESVREGFRAKMSEQTAKYIDESSKIG